MHAMRAYVFFSRWISSISIFHTPSGTDRVPGHRFSKPLSRLFQDLFQILEEKEEEEDLVRLHPEAGIPQHLWWWEGTRGFSLPFPTNPCTCDSTDDPPTERTCISSWNRSETSGWDCFQSDSVAARGFGNSSTTTASTS